ncbi:MAG: acylphosphatase, partial [Verrucomicrobiales bacterium]
MTCKKIIFTGRVQGVGFRYQTKQLALGFDLTGTVRNLPDGSVELIIAGEAPELADFLHELCEESELAHHIKDRHLRE